MEQNKRAIGARCEGAACLELEKNGYTVITRNYFPGGGLHGEIDIICEDEKYIVFVEVKARKDRSAPSAYGRPALAVNTDKRAHMTAAADAYLRQNPTGLQPRLDVMEVWYTLTPDGGCAFRFNHLKNAFRRQS